MRKGSLLMAWLGLGLSLPAAAAQRVAVVVALSDYANLPDPLNLPTATADAAALSTFLDDRGGYDQVYTLTDASATREAPAQGKPPRCSLRWWCTQGWGARRVATCAG